MKFSICAIPLIASTTLLNNIFSTHESMITAQLVDSSFYKGHVNHNSEYIWLFRILPLVLMLNFFQIVGSILYFVGESPTLLLVARLIQGLGNVRKYQGSTWNMTDSFIIYFICSCRAHMWYSLLMFAELRHLKKELQVIR